MPEKSLLNTLMNAALPDIDWQRIIKHRVASTQDKVALQRKTAILSLKTVILREARVNNVAAPHKTVFTTLEKVISRDTTNSIVLTVVACHMVAEAHIAAATHLHKAQTLFTNCIKKLNEL